MNTGICASELVLEKGLCDFQVFQRNSDNKATILMNGTAAVEGKILLNVQAEGKPLTGFDHLAAGEAKGGKWTAMLTDLPVGGPYTVQVQLVAPDGNQVAEIIVQRILVGDLWVLGGQSNMEGVGDILNVEEPSDRINVFRMRHEWDEAREPIHRLYESVDRVHYGRHGDKPSSREEADKLAAETTKGAGLGLPFAKQMVARTGVPVGLVPVAHGGTTMDQWDPNLAGMGGDSMYGSFLNSLQAVGGRVHGFLWYQGESETIADDKVPSFTSKFIHLVEKIREDTGDPNLPFYYVQIGCVAFKPDPLSFSTTRWNAIQELQRQCETVIPKVGIVSSIDLAIDDVIHIGTSGLKRLGKRLANLALAAPSTGPRFDRLEVSPGTQESERIIRVVFKGGSGKLLAPGGRVAGFTFRDAKGEDQAKIYKAIVDPEQPNSVLLYVIDLPADVLLWYGNGLMPFCNLTDSEDMAVPVMGPLAIPKVDP